MTDCFYEIDGDRFIASPWTRGPWDARAQHAGPPAALVGRAIERLEPDGDMRVARFTLEIFRPIMVAPLRVEARLVRPGRRVQFAEATLSDDDGEVARASAWRIRASDPPVAEEVTEGSPPPGPDGLESYEFPNLTGTQSYLSAMEGRFARGAFSEPGPAAAWMRMRIPLVGGEEPSPLTRALAAADSGNGISQVLDPRTHLFINTELTVHLVRAPVDDWVCLDAVTRIDPHGIGLAESVLWDRRGRIGGGRQSLYVSAR